MRISERARRPVGLFGLLLFWLVVSLMLWANVTRQSTDYGTGYGRFADQVDSHSEYLVRNSVIERVRTGDLTPGFLIYTRGYADQDYSYYPGAVRRYFSNRAIQTDIFAHIANLDRHFFLDHHSAYFQLFRLLNSAAMAACIITFFVSLFGRNRLGLGLALALSLSGGVALFASNLYFTAWLLFSPLLCYPLVRREKYGWYCGAAFLLSLAYFAVRYEFASTFALMWILPLLVKALDGAAPRLRWLVSAFACCCLGFAAALLLHHLSVANVIHGSLADASRQIFVTLQLRMASLTNVPAPFTPGFVKSLLKRWDWTGFAIPMILSVSKLAVILLYILACRHYRRSRPVMLILGWALAAYLSWYILSYQHIMLHMPYDSLLFAGTLQLAVVIVAGVAIRDGLADGHWVRETAPS